MKRLENRIRELQRAHPDSAAVVPLTGGRAAALKWLAPSTTSFDVFPDLEDVAKKLTSWVPLAVLDGHCALVGRKAPHAVAWFAEGFQVLAPSLEVFFSHALLEAGEKSPFEKVFTARQKARAQVDRKAFAGAATALQRALKVHPLQPDPVWSQPDLDRELGAAFLLLGYAEWKLERLTDARAHYTAALAYGNFQGAGNLGVMDLKSGQFEAAIALATQTLKKSSGSMSTSVELGIVGNLVVAHWFDGRLEQGTAVMRKWLAAHRGERQALKADIASWLREKPLLMKHLEKCIP